MGRLALPTPVPVLGSVRGEHLSVWPIPPLQGCRNHKAPSALPRLLQQGKAKEALPLLKRAHEIRPDDPDAALNLGGAYLMSGRHRDAIPLLERAVEQAPDSARLWISLGAAYLGNPILAGEEQQLKALSAFQQALKIDPLYPRAHMELAKYFEAHGDAKRATHHRRMAGEFAPR